MTEPEPFWRLCSSCKKEIGFGRVHQVCSVSTCRRKGTGFVFCSVECWDAHLPVMRHREAWAEDEWSPSRAEWERERAEKPAAPPSRTSSAPPPPSYARPSPAPAATPSREDELIREILVVASKVKQYIRARSGMNTSDGVLEVLSDRLRALCDDAIGNAKRAGRQTVLPQDFE